MSNGQSCVVVSVVVKFGQDNVVEFDFFLEGYCSVDCVLINYGVNDEEGFVRVGSSFDVSCLSYYFGVDVQMISGVDDDDVVQFVFGFCDGIMGYLDGIFNFVVRFRSEDVYFGMFFDYL